MDVDTYIENAAPEAQAHLRQLRAIIKKHAPDAEEYVGYGMPGYRLNGPLVYFGAFKTHVGLYATPRGHEAFAKQLAKYKQSKGGVQFPLDETLPAKLIANMVKLRVQQNNPFASLSKPAQRALFNAGITSLAKLKRTSEEKLLTLHGLGAAASPKLRRLLRGKD